MYPGEISALERAGNDAIAPATSTNTTEIETPSHAINLRSLLFLVI
jgi:hypothetical protein